MTTNPAVHRPKKRSPEHSGRESASVREMYVRNVCVPRPQVLENKDKIEMASPLTGGGDNMTLTDG